MIMVAHKPKVKYTNGKNKMEKIYIPFMLLHN